MAVSTAGTEQTHSLGESSLDKDQKQLHLLRSALAQTDDRLSIISLDYTYLYTNASNARHYGTQPENMLGASLVSFLGNARFYGTTKARLDRCFEGETLAYTHTSPQSTTRADPIALIKLAPYRDETGTIVGAIATQRDVTAETTAQIALREREQHFRSLFEDSLLGIAIVDENSRFLCVNEAYANTFGYGVDDVMIMPSSLSLYQPGEHERLAYYSRSRVQGVSVPTTYEVEALHKDGSKVILQQMAKHVQWYGKRACLVAAVDITSRREIEAALRTSEQRFRDFAAASSDWFWEVDKELRIVWISEDFERVTGESRSRYYGQATFSTKPSGCGAAEWRSVMQQLSRHEPVRNHDRVITLSDDRSMWVRTNCNPVFTNDGSFAGYRCTSTDITGLRDADARAAKADTRFRDFAETAADWFFELDEELRFTYVSERLLQLLKLQPKRILGNSFRDLYSRVANVPEHVSERLQIFDQHEAFSDLELPGYGADGSLIHCSVSAKPLFARSGRFLGYRGTARNVTNARKLANQLKHQATHDALTGLPNRIQFERTLTHALAAVKSNNTNAVLCFMDLDQFKIVNDTAGHAAGDRMLRQVADAIPKSLRSTDVVSRLGGDEFGIILRDCSVDEARAMIARVIENITTLRIRCDQNTYSIGASAGLVSIQEHAVSVGELMSKADLACYTAKDLGRNRVHVFSISDHESTRRHRDLLRISDIRLALERNRFMLHMQPIARLTDSSDEFSHCEVLLRMYDPEENVLLPHAFIPAAEQYGLMNHVDRWVVANALPIFAAMRADGNEHVVHINLSGTSLNDESFADFMRVQLDNTGFPGNSLCIEITETALISNMRHAQNFIDSMKELGCQFALDDFGSGLSSFKYLKNFNVDYLKIDGSFVQGLDKDQSGFAMVSAINEMGHALGVETVAEFVETKEVRSCLLALKVDFIQGHLIGEPQELPLIGKSAETLQDMVFTRI